MVEHDEFPASDRADAADEVAIPRANVKRALVTHTDNLCVHDESWPPRVAERAGHDSSGYVALGLLLGVGGMDVMGDRCGRPADRERGR